MNVARVSRLALFALVTVLPVACGRNREDRPASPDGGVRHTALPTQVAIAAADACRYVGQTGTVCGVVVSGRFAARSKGRPTFLNLDQPWPNHVFTVVIWQRDRAKFPASPEAYYRDRRICVTGRIVEYRGRAQIVVTAPAQVVMSEIVETIPAGGR
jgi:hypothetical protein